MEFRRRAKAVHDGAFVWGDLTNSDVASFAINTFSVRASGGTKFYSSSGLLTGVELEAGSGTWSDLSDRNVKENFQKVDSREILERLAAIPIETWNYKTQDDSIRHIGLMAQDFHAAFGVGGNKTRITTIDADGVALAAIQGLNQILREKETEIAALRSEKDAQIADLAGRLERLEAMMSKMTARK